jgi:DNA-binding CsgD family transcriptional regulator
MRVDPIHDISLLAPEDVVVVYRLIEQLCERGNDARLWREHLLSELRRLFASSMVLSYLMSFSLDPTDIAPKTMINMQQGANPFWLDYVARGDLGANPITPFIMERFGTDFTCAREEWVDDQTWRASPFYENVVKPSNWEHMINSQVGIIRPGVVDGIGICRKPGDPPYTPKDVAMLRLIHQELARLWRKHDPMDAHTLPPRQREVLEGIRRGESRKAIADKMGVSDHTIHTYEKALFDRAKVTSRMELLSMVSKVVRPVLMP